MPWSDMPDYLRAATYDMDDYTALDLIGIGAVVFGLGVTYWLISLADDCSGPARGDELPRPFRAAGEGGRERGPTAAQE